MKQGEIWQINLEPTVGAEMQKTRPVLIINTDTLGKLPLKVVLPITAWKDHYRDCPWMIRIDPTTKNGLVKKSSIDCFQIRSVSVNRFVSFMDATDPEIIVQAQQAIAKVVGTI